jgi:hypothetical protein
MYSLVPAHDLQQRLSPRFHACGHLPSNFSTLHLSTHQLGFGLFRLKHTASYATYDETRSRGELVGHTDDVWDLALVRDESTLWYRGYGQSMGRQRTLRRWLALGVGLA